MKIFHYGRVHVVLIALLVLSCVSAHGAEPNSRVSSEPYSCLGPQLPFKDYETTTTKTLQTHLRIIYQGDYLRKKDSQPVGRALSDGALHDAALNNGALSDGVMGKETLRLMNRFCGDYSLHKLKDIASEMPKHAACAADFSQSHGHEHSLLMSKDFAQWRAAEPDVMREQITLAFSSCDTTEWLAIIKRYLARNTQATRPATEEKKAPNTLYRYVLTADDLKKLQQPNLVTADIKNLAGKIFSVEADADIAIEKVLQSLSKDIQQQLNNDIHQQLTSQVIYQFNETNLGALATAGLTAVQIAALDKLPKHAFTNEEAFKKLVAHTLANIPLASGAGAATEDNNAQVATSDTRLIIPTTKQSPADVTLAQIRVLNATRSLQITLSAEAANKISNQYFPPDKNVTISPVVVKAIASLQDIEYPDGDLFHFAAMDKIVKAMAVCKRNDSNSVDARMLPLTASEQKNLVKLVLGTKADDKQSLSEGADRICDETFLKDIAATYNRDYKPAIRLVYRKQAPAYEGKDILWSGDKCGCIPPQISVSAYGIYPYWQQSDTRQHFDFSTFSRVGYYGFSFNGSGQIIQANIQTQSQTLLDINSNISPKFVTVARTFGSKLDWVIEKDWNEETRGGTAVNEVQIRATLAGLRNNIVSLLTRPLNDPVARIRPWSSLGIAHVPTMGDGVTLYFKNYPETTEAKNEFDNFFRNLKSELKNINTATNYWHSLKQDYFVNLIVQQDDYLSSAKIFSAKNIFSLLNVTYEELEPLTALGEQHKIQTLVLVLLKEPYYNALAKLQGSLTINNRSYILPTVVMDFRNFSTETNQIDEHAKESYDERRKTISFQREAFGGGAFWKMPSVDALETERFNRYIADNTSLGFEHNLWDDTVCAYRWLIIDIMNAWLCIALVFVLIVFYIFPHRCRHLTGIARLLIEPPALTLIIIPPIALWIYLLAVDDSFPFWSVPSFLNMLLLVLSAMAVIKSVRELKQRKPTRDFVQLQAAQLPKRRQQVPVTSADDNEFSG